MCEQLLGHMMSCHPILSRGLIQPDCLLLLLCSSVVPSLLPPHTIHVQCSRCCCTSTSSQYPNLAHHQLPPNPPSAVFHPPPFCIVVPADPVPTARLRKPQMQMQMQRPQRLPLPKLVTARFAPLALPRPPPCHPVSLG